MKVEVVKSEYGSDVNKGKVNNGKQIMEKQTKESGKNVLWIYTTSIMTKEKNHAIVTAERKKRTKESPERKVQ